MERLAMAGVGTQIKIKFKAILKSFVNFVTFVFFVVKNRLRTAYKLLIAT
jgi:hypothetical protein